MQKLGYREDFEESWVYHKNFGADERYKLVEYVLVEGTALHPNKISKYLYRHDGIASSADGSKPNMSNVDLSDQRGDF